MLARIDAELKLKCARRRPGPLPAALCCCRLAADDLRRGPDLRRALSDRYKQMEQGAEMAELMADEIRGLRGQLRSAP